MDEPRPSWKRLLERIARLFGPKKRSHEAFLAPRPLFQRPPLSIPKAVKHAARNVLRATSAAHVAYDEARRNSR